MTGTEGDVTVAEATANFVDGLDQLIEQAHTAKLPDDVIEAELKARLICFVSSPSE